MTADAITRALAARNGGPGLTADELAQQIGLPRATVRNELARLIFERKTVTCDRDGRYSLGDPVALIKVLG